MLAAASVVGVRVILGVVANGVAKVSTACSPAESGLAKVDVPVVMVMVPAVSLPSMV